MNVLHNMVELLVYSGVMGAFLWSVVGWGLISNSVQAEEPPPAATRLKFDGFELELPLGLRAEEFHVPADNPMNADKVALGHSLFFDTRLSIDNSVSCATCHSPQGAFTDNRQLSLGVGSQPGERNTPTLLNRAFSREQFWDGRAPSLEEQTKDPLINPKEMGMPSLEQVAKKVRAIKGYQEWFRRVFGRDVHIDDLTKAIAAFERTLVSGNSKFDQFKAGNSQALSEDEIRGFGIFIGKARCNQCHSGMSFADEKYHNLGVDWDTNSVDLGRYRVTNNKEDIGAFKTPTLRDIAETAPYMHNGEFATLEEVVDFYNKGGIANPFLDVEMKRSTRTLIETLELYENKERVDKRSSPDELVRLDLTQQEQVDLVAFLKTLSGKGWRHIKPPDSFPQ